MLSDAACLDRPVRQRRVFPPLNHQTYMQPVTDPVRRPERITIAWDSNSPARYFTGETHTSLAARTVGLVTVKSEIAERGSRY
jgi:hypothetical protein